jgi:hypothetical protein
MSAFYFSFTCMDGYLCVHGWSPPQYVPLALFSACGLCSAACIMPGTCTSHCKELQFHAGTRLSPPPPTPPSHPSPPSPLHPRQYHSRLLNDTFPVLHKIQYKVHKLCTALYCINQNNNCMNTCILRTHLDASTAYFSLT